MNTSNAQAVDWNGPWHGYYAYSQSHPFGRLADRRFKFTANFIQTGEQLEGTIIDEDTHLELAFRDYVDGISAKLGSIHRRNFELLLSKFPHARLAVSLPETANIRGHVNNDKISFTKSYSGKGHHRIECDGKQIADAEIQNSPIEYVGELNSVTGVVEGKWGSYHKRFFGLLRRFDSGGTFSLFKSSGAVT